MATVAPIVSVPLRCSTCGESVALRYRVDQRLPREFHRWTCPYPSCRGTGLTLLSGEVIEASVYAGPLAKDGQP